MNETKNDQTAAICYLCDAERPIEAMAVELIDGGMVWVCGGIDPVTGEDAITDCETRRGV